MNRPTFDHTVGILVKAYLNDTLEHGNCCACAVGNIIAGTHGYKYVTTGNSFCAVTMKWKDGQRPRWYDDKVDGYVYESSQTLATGYSVAELRRIEIAFESVWPGDFDRMFNGLMAVVDVLASIHNVDISIKEEAKKLFVKV